MNQLLSNLRTAPSVSNYNHINLGGVADSGTRLSLPDHYLDIMSMQYYMYFLGRINLSWVLSVRALGVMNRAHRGKAKAMYWLSLIMEEYPRLLSDEIVGYCSIPG